VIVLDTHIWVWWLESTRLPGTFHRDPADQLIVATARLLGAPVVTGDRKIRDYAHVATLW